MACLLGRCSVHGRRSARPAMAIHRPIQQHHNPHVWHPVFRGRWASSRNENNSGEAFNQGDRQMRWIAIFLGVVTGGFFMGQDWTPLIRHTPNTDASYSDIKDSEKRAFIRTLFETFESENPHAELQDVIGSNYPSAEEIKANQAQFDQSLNRLRVGPCPVKKIVIPTRWQNMEAIDRAFHVFDIEHCNF
jgi:hypothetical protein